MSEEDWETIHDYARIAYYCKPPKKKAATIEPKVWHNEIGGMAVMKYTKQGWLIFNPTILQQTVSGTICTLDKDKLSLYYSDMFGKYGKCRFVWWHSHHTMSANWSGTDTDTIEENATSDWSASLLINLKGEHKLRIQFFRPLECSIDTEVSVLRPKRKLSKALYNEVVEKCSEKTYAVTKWNRGNDYTYGYGGYGDYGQYDSSYYKGENPKSIDTDKARQRNLFNHGRDDELDEDFVYSYIDDLNKHYVKSTIDYTQWRNCVRASNQKLNEHGMKIIEFKKKKLEEIIYTAKPDDFITYHPEAN